MLVAFMEKRGLLQDTSARKASLVHSARCSVFPSTFGFGWLLSELLCSFVALTNSTTLYNIIWRNMSHVLRLTAKNLSFLLLLGMPHWYLQRCRRLQCKPVHSLFPWDSSKSCKFYICTRYSWAWVIFSFFLGLIYLSSFSCPFPSFCLGINLVYSLCHMDSEPL